MATPTISDLILPELANNNFSRILGELKRHTLSIHNRLRSILEDAAFVQKVYKAYDRPLVANERCGSWYIDPPQKHGSAYFKSTDGHTGVWSFSTRRLNTHLLEIIGKHDGCIVVDSTRRGKRMPDALSKTVPIWCSVLNHALFPDEARSHGLYTPPRVVSSSEKEQIASRLDSYLQSFLALDMDLPKLRSRITKPLRPIWVTPESYLTSVTEVFDDFHPIICCTASRRVTGGEISDGGYIQGSGDDTENWAFGLTPAIFWANKDLLLSKSETELPELITKLTTSTTSPSILKDYALASIPPTTSLHITSLTSLDNQVASPQKIIILLYPEIGNFPAADISKDLNSSFEFKAGIGPHKFGSRNLRITLPSIINFLDPKRNPDSQMDIIVACSTGKDHSVGVALAFLCLFYDDQGRLKGRISNKDNHKIDKAFIRRRLSWIMSAIPDANPSGATLQSINSYLMSPPR